MKGPKLSPDAKPVYRSVQDLRVLNRIADLPHPVAPYPIQVFPKIPSDANWFTFLDLTTACLNIPPQEEYQLLFDFTWKGQQYGVTRLL